MRCVLHTRSLAPSPCRLVTLSPCHLAEWPLCRLVACSIGRLVGASLRCFVAWSLCHFVAFTCTVLSFLSLRVARRYLVCRFCWFVALSPCRFAALRFCRVDASSLSSTSSLCCFVALSLSSTSPFLSLRRFVASSRCRFVVFVPLSLRRPATLSPRRFGASALCGFAEQRLCTGCSVAAATVCSSPHHEEI